MKLCQGKFRLGIRKRFFSQRLVRHWTRLPREVFIPHNLPELKKCLDNAFRHMWNSRGGPVQDPRMILVSHFQLRIFYDSTNHFALEFTFNSHQRFRSLIPEAILLHFKRANNLLFTHLRCVTQIRQSVQML